LIQAQYDAMAPMHAPATCRTERIVVDYSLSSATLALSVPCCRILVCTVS